MNKKNIDIELSGDVLSYRSEENIIPFVEKLKCLLNELNIYWYLVLIGNYLIGSNNKTKKIIKTLAKADKRIKPIIKPKKGMMGWDVRKGLATDGKYICVIEGDVQYSIESVIECYKRIKKGNLDLVKTYRIKRYDGIYRHKFKTKNINS
ncbi:MAG TPA: glycosyltransferase [bacterium]|nr:glycosyltransferase [bacterium]